MNKRSLEILATCHDDLQRLVTAVDKIIPIRVTEGYRNDVRQERLYLAGVTEVERGKHNLHPSEAVDICPEPVDWLDENRFYLMDGIVIATAHYLGIKVRLGADWDGDTEVLDQTFNDLGHIELKNSA